MKQDKKSEDIVPLTANDTSAVAKKKTYIAPKITVTLIELEEAIAAGSGTLRPGNISGEIKEEWEVVPDDDRPFAW